MNERAIHASLFVALLALSSCSPVEELDSPLGTDQSEIVGGTVTTSDPEVFMLSVRYSNGTQGMCSATLINRRTLVTAAHCVDPRVGNSQSVDIWVTHDTYALSAAQTQTLTVDEVALHPLWSPARGTLEHDIALLLLSDVPTAVMPKPWNTANIAGFVGRPLRAVGYGTTGPGAPQSAGVKREVALTFRAIDVDHIYLGDMVGRGVCNGDSGGPSFHTFVDGVERVVGVHSYTTTEACVDGADIRIDAYAQWINAFMAAREGPQCTTDGVCVNGCAPIDQDCVCVADEQCSPHCLDAAQDPDCPMNCAADGVCEPSGCAVPDDDCVADGEPCHSAAVCPGKRCINDAQHDALYCSRNCTSGAECPNGMECSEGACRLLQLPNIAPNALCIPNETYCIGRLTCAGVEGEATRCVATCELDSHCPRDVPCVDSPYGRFCKIPEARPVVVPLANAEARQAAGCAASPGAVPSLALLLLAMRSRRRANVVIRQRQPQAVGPPSASAVPPNSSS